MEVYIPIHDFDGFGPWRRPGLGPRSGLSSPSEFCTRRGRGVFEHPFGRRGGCSGRRGGARSMIPRNMHIAFDNMDLDDWISPADVLAAVFARAEQPQPRASAPAAPASSNEATATPASASPPSTVSADTNKNQFEVKLNVSGYKPETLNVTVANGVITIEGKQEETKTEKDDEGKEVISEEFVSRRFKRSFTIPLNAIEEKLECKMTADGQLVLSAPLKCIEPAPEEPATRSIPISIAPAEELNRQEDVVAESGPANNMVAEPDSTPMETEKNN